MKNSGEKLGRERCAASIRRWLQPILFRLILFPAFGIGFPAAAQTKIIVRVAVETVVENQTVNLGDIAQISGDERQIERLKNVSLGYAPNIGAVRELSRDRILLVISTAGYAPNDFRLESPPSVGIRRAAQEISRLDIRQAIENAVRNQISSDVIEARLVKVDLPEKIDAPLGKVEIRSNLAGVRNLFAPFSVAVEIRVNDAVFRRISVNAEIEASAEVFVAKKNLDAGAKISAADVRLEKRRIEKPLSFYLRDTEKLRGAKLIRNVAGGAEIVTDSLIAGVVIRAGDAVRIVGQSGKLEIIVNGEARGSGKIGDRIAVKNLQSNAFLQAVVVDEGLVKIFF